jgi:hypothetical protein
MPSQNAARAAAGRATARVIIDPANPCETVSMAAGS